MTDNPLAGRRIIILEDDYYQAHDSKDTLEEAGATVIAVTATVPDLAPHLAGGPIDAVLIDINLGRSLSFDFARTLRSNAIPFLFLTGYDAGMLPEDLAASPYISKPADRARIVKGLTELIAGQS
ncbi:response regulator [Erythrobacter sp. WG]|uniref:response regulator n=1 Tax=Erythrobacter sp. WG TaxID=2985510 RepID=UPI002270740E|nr:response regulator [Erythrobacter sp. WG]MCX9147043.1 response regulator [Erythrobacter sp. WG]